MEYIICYVHYGLNEMDRAGLCIGPKDMWTVFQQKSTQRFRITSASQQLAWSESSRAGWTRPARHKLKKSKPVNYFEHSAHMQ